MLARCCFNCWYCISFKDRGLFCVKDGSMVETYGGYLCRDFAYVPEPPLEPYE